jgi:hypothetical protein
LTSTRNAEYRDLTRVVRAAEDAIDAAVDLLFTVRWTATTRKMM